MLTDSRIYNERQLEYIEMKKEEEEKRILNLIKIQKEINFEATTFGLWFVNLTYLACFTFFSFIVLRFLSTSW